jgi:glycosyltransferase involved in cell wall biosynthesis
LRSVRAQQYRNLEIIVVDDGSTDGTAAIVERHAMEDGRVRLVQQANAGVAAARNRGLAEASGPFVAPVDADDLWRPDKIGLQLALAAQRGPQVSLVYTWFAGIDAESRILGIARPVEEGHVLQALCVRNFVGHASSPLMRTADALRVGGYDPSLRARNAQGCEDWHLYMKLAEIGEFAVVKSMLTGYRDNPCGMSRNVGQMLRSHQLVMAEFQAKYPLYRSSFFEGRQVVCDHYLRRALRAGDYGDVRASFLRICRNEPRLGLYLFYSFLRGIEPTRLGRAVWRRIRRRPARPVLPHFMEPISIEDDLFAVTEEAQPRRRLFA